MHNRNARARERVGSIGADRAAGRRNRMANLRQVLTVCCTLSIAGWLALTPSRVTSHGPDQCAGLLAVPVQEGYANLTLWPGEQDQYLIIVSSLATGAGPFAVEIASEPLANPIRSLADAPPRESA